MNISLNSFHIYLLITNGTTSYPNALSESSEIFIALLTESLTDKNSLSYKTPIFILLF
jgi:hypothetical protein